VCPTNRTVYIASKLLSTIRSAVGAGDTANVLAFVLAHEVGHVVQLAVNSDAFANPTVTVEDQADCLAGVWAFDLATRGGLDVGNLNDAVVRFLDAALSDPGEVAGHGTPVDRLAALRLGESEDGFAVCRSAFKLR
jgi:predicted metalloprotease